MLLTVCVQDELSDPDCCPPGAVVAGGGGGLATAAC
jgi:hypothetical protein